MTLAALISPPRVAAAAAVAPVRVLDVPYVPQSAALCGGAAVAMVLRYWGEPAVLAEDFIGRLEPDGAGIRADTLVQAVRVRGWTAFPIRGTPDTVRGELAQGRPVIALVRVGKAAYHYVVLVAWANGGVIYHDPASAPFRTRDERAFDADWAASGRWALIVLPPASTPTPLPDSSAATTLPPPALDGCGGLVDEAIRRARAGDTAGAEQRLRSAQALCPDSAAPLRGLAGLRFTSKDWAAAATMAEAALRIEPDDPYTWRLLASSRFLLHDELGALRAWNHVSEPRADLARVEGLERIPYRAVAGQLALPPGRLLSARAYSLARRRLAEIPAQSASLLRLEPRPQGTADVAASVLERPLLFEGPLDAGGTGLRAVITREAAIRVASPTGFGELWTATARWRSGRPRVSLGVTAPAGGGLPGLWRLEGSWERQAYALVTGVTHEERRRSALSFASWIAPALRLEVGAALDRWSERGAHLAFEAGSRVLLADDRLEFGVEAGQWTSLDHAAPFRTGRAGASWGPRPGVDGGWRARVGLARASGRAPLALWPGAGTGSGRESLLRAHPLLAEGVVAGPAFGRSLVDAGLELESAARPIGLVRIGVGVFVDAARAGDRLRASEPSPGWLLDGGASLRIAPAGTRGLIRLTAAHGLLDGASAVSLAWETR